MHGHRQVRASVPEDGPAIVALMKEAGLQPHEQPRHLDWKYWQRRQDWPGSRSFVLTGGHEILAHIALVPGSCRLGVARSRVAFAIDWAARPREIGAGVFLMKHMSSVTDLVLAVGGSAQALNIMPRIGFEQRGSMTGYVRSLSPLVLLKRPCQPRWKRAPRFVRSVLWSVAAPKGGVSDWQVRRLGEHELTDIRAALPSARPGLAALERCAALLRHALECPILPMELYALEKAGRVGGYFLMSYAPAQARLVDCWMASEQPADWRDMVHAAIRQAKRRGGLAELVAWSNDPLLSAALVDSGFHSRLTLPIYLRGSADAGIPHETLRVQMLDGDASYLYFGNNELWA